MLLTTFEKNNKMNVRKYFTNYPVFMDDVKYKCVRCESEVILDDSYSCNGQFLLCTHCVNELAKMYKMRTGDVIKKFVWKKVRFYG